MMRVNFIYRYAKCHYAECCYAECRYTGCRSAAARDFRQQLRTHSIYLLKTTIITIIIYLIIKLYLTDYNPI
jgi:hypothetical protein